MAKKKLAGYEHDIKNGVVKVYGKLTAAEKEVVSILASAGNKIETATRPRTKDQQKAIDKSKMDKKEFLDSITEKKDKTIAEKICTMSTKDNGGFFAAKAWVNQGCKTDKNGKPTYTSKKKGTVTINL